MRIEFEVSASDEDNEAAEFRALTLVPIEGSKVGAGTQISLVLPRDHEVFDVEDFRLRVTV